MSTSRPRLVVLDGARQGTAIEISRPLSIGSNQSSDLHLRDAAVSWNHARVWAEGSDVLVEDLGSANGTLVNDMPIQRAVLGPGDVLKVGNSRLAVAGSEASSPTAAGKKAGQGGSILTELEEAKKALQKEEEENRALRGETNEQKEALALR